MRDIMYLLSLPQSLLKPSIARIGVSYLNDWFIDRAKLSAASCRICYLYRHPASSTL